MPTAHNNKFEALNRFQPRRILPNAFWLFYCGKYSAPHTDAEYREFLAWHTTFKIVAAVSGIAIVVLTLWVDVWVKGNRSDKA